jgi:hypothetical protein
MIFSNKMEIKCPKCGVTIDYLLNRVYRVEECETRYDEERDELNWGEWMDGDGDSVISVISSEYLCPFCHERVAEDYNDVLKILRGK